MKLANLVEIKNYVAGKNGNMLVSLDEVIKLDGDYISPKGETRDVNVLLCTAYVDPEAREVLKKYVQDDYTPYDTVIVVSKKFMKLGNKRQLALLEIQNAGVSLDDPLTNVSRRVYGEISAIEKYGKIVTKLAVTKEHNMMEKSISKVSRGYHHQYKKDNRAQKSFNILTNILGKNNNVGNDDFDFDELLKQAENEMDLAGVEITPDTI